MKQKILLLLTLFSIASMMKAQDTEFWFAASQSSETVVAGYPLYRPVFLAISNPNSRSANVQITLYNGGSPIVINEVIPAAGFYKKDFITEAEVAQILNPRSHAGNVTKYGVHISSDIEVAAYYMVNNANSRDIYAFKGKNALGTEFYVPMQHDHYYPQTATWAGSYDQIDIVASEDDTEVIVIPNTTIRVGTLGSAPANTAYTKTLNKGETLKIMEHSQNSGSLAGTHITASRPITVSVTEDMVNGDTSGDQIAPVSSLGTQYVVAKGYMSSAQAERIYFVGTANNTTLKIYNGGTDVTTTINAGDCYVYNFSQSPSTQSVVFIDASSPVYVYQRTGYTEQGAALVPSLKSILQKKATYFQVNADETKGVLVYRNGTEDAFTVTYGGTTSSLTINPLSIPNIADWKCARIDLPIAANNQVVSISNSKGYFSFGYIAANFTSKSTSFGYLTEFGVFMFPYDIIYKCPDATTVLEGGYADSYKWEYATTESGPYIPLSETGYSLTTINEGYYKLTMTQSSDVTSATVQVRNLDFQTAILPSNIPPQAATTTFSTSINPIIASDPNLDISYYWEFEGGTPATSTEASPTVTWTTGERIAKVTVAAEANSTSNTGSCSATVTKMAGFNISPANQEVCKDNIGEISTDFYISDADTYQWQYSTNGITWADIPGATAYTYKPSYQELGTSYYRIVITDKTGAETLESIGAKVISRRCVMPVNPNIHAYGEL